LFKEILYALLVNLAADVEVISVFFVGAIFAKYGSVVAAVAQSINIGVVFAENLEVILSLSNLAFGKFIDL
jgi:hypothetical protein